MFLFFFFFFFNDTATTEIYTLSLHDALPIYLDGGLEAARSAILAMLEGAGTERTQQRVTDAKTQLQEVVQALGWDLPEYRLVGAEGPDHNKVFSVECWLNGEPAGKGEGPSKKMAEQHAAADALSRLPEEEK